jgi:hypothetical protein
MSVFSEDERAVLVEAADLKIPAEVARVFKALKANAKKAGDADRAYMSSPAIAVHDGEWSLGDNYERSPNYMIYRDGKWFTRAMHSGHDKPMRGGSREAMANAEIFFTG